jgi:hypothetical protein
MATPVLAAAVTGNDIEDDTCEDDDKRWRVVQDMSKNRKE